MNKTLKKGLLILFICGGVFGYYYSGLGQYLSFEVIKSQQAAFHQLYLENQLQFAVAFFVCYVVVVALSLPGAVWMTLLGGAIFGLVYGTILVSFASSVGALAVFFLARSLFKESLERKFSKQLQTINQGVEREGAYYLFTLRLIPLFPFFLINILLSLTRMPAWTFYWVSQIGMLPGTILYVNAGTQLSQLESVSGIMSPAIIGSFVLLGIFPIATKKILQHIALRKIYRQYPKPKQFDYNLIVIGAGAAGLVNAYIASAVKAKVALIEKHQMGGDCLNTGCVPSKALIKSARLAHDMQQAKTLGITVQGEVNFTKIMARIQRVIKTVEPHDSVERYTKLGVDCIQGNAELLSPYMVSVGDQEITAKHIVIATGARPFVPSLPGLDEIEYVTSDTVWQLKQLPKRLLVLGGGPIGCELAQSFARLGSKVIQLEMLPRILAKEDEKVSELMHAQLLADGVEIHTGTRAVRWEKTKTGSVLIAETESGEISLGFDIALLALGRVANVADLGLEQLGIRLTERNTIEVDSYLRSNIPNIFACGDVAGPYQFTHTASHQAWFTAVNALFGRFKKFKVDYRVIPWVTYTQPEVATVGLNERAAQEQRVAYNLTDYDLRELDRAITEDLRQGFVRVLTKPNSDKILGVTIVAEHAGEMLTEFTLAMRHGLGLNKILQTIHPYPTWSEANKYAAGEWKKKQVSEKLLTFLSRFHAWMRR